MDIFESLENLPVSESCFEDIVNIAEYFISEKVSVKQWRAAAIRSLEGRAVKAAKADDKSFKAMSRNASEKTQDKYAEEAAKADERLEHAREVATTMRDSKIPANRVMRAAELSSWTRENEPTTPERRRAREYHANSLSDNRRYKETLQDFKKED